MNERVRVFSMPAPSGRPGRPLATAAAAAPRCWVADNGESAVAFTSREAAIAYARDCWDSEPTVWGEDTWAQR